MLSSAFLFLMSAPLILPVTAFMLGIWLNSCLSLPILPLIEFGLIASIAAILFRRLFWLGLLALAVSWISLGMARTALWSSHPENAPIASLSDEPQAVVLRGAIVEDPQTHRDRRGKTFQGSTLLVSHAYQSHPYQSHQWKPLRARLRLFDYSGRQALNFGEELLIEAAWLRAPQAGNPGQFDWRRALARDRVQGIVRITSGDTVVSLNQAKPVYSKVFALRRRCEAFIGRTFNKEQAGLLRSFLLGQRSTLEESDQEAFIETGMMHLLVVSGFNVGLIAVLCEGLLRIAGFSFRLRPLLVALAIAGYCLLTGMQPPVVRAAWMAWTALGAAALGRVVCWPNLLSFAALVMLMINPMELFDPSFQLSAGAVASLLLFASRIEPAVARLLRWVPTGLVKQVLLPSLSATIAVAIGLSPVLIWYFHLYAPVALIANVLLVPLVSVLVSLGTPFVLAGALVDSEFISYLGVPIRWLLTVILKTVQSCHKIPYGHHYVAHPAWAVIIGYYALVLVTIGRKAARLSARNVLCCWSAFVLLWFFSGMRNQWRASRLLSVYVVDVGHGDSVVIQTPNRQTLIVDCGSQEAGRNRLVPFLRYQGIRSIDALVLTHTDEDHIGGAIPLLEAIPVKQLLTNGVSGDTLSAKQVRRLADFQHAQARILAAGERIPMDPSVTIEVLHPPRGLVPDVPGQSNDNSMVLRVVFGQVSFLLTGDIEEQGLPWLLKSNQPLKATVLKVPHHGSRLGAPGRDFFREVRPELAVLSVGTKHHLPAAQTLQDLREAGAYLLSTRNSGMVALKTDGKRLFVKQFHKGRNLRIIPDS